MFTIPKETIDANAAKQKARQPNPQAAGLYTSGQSNLGGGDIGTVGNSAGTGTGINTQQREVATGPMGMFKGGADQYTLDQSLAQANTGGLDAAANARYDQLTKNPRSSYYAVRPQAAVQSEFRGQQQGLADMLQAQALGQGPSAAQSTLQLANDKAINAQMAMARSGGNPAAMRQAMFNAATLTQQNAGEAASLRANEMQRGRELYASQLQGARGLDDSMSQFNAGQANQAEAINAGNYGQAAQQDERVIQMMIDRGYSRADAERNANMEIAKINLGILTGAEQADIAADRAAYDPVTRAVNGVIDGGVKAGMAYATGGMSGAPSAPAPTAPMSDFQLKSPWLGR